MTYDKPGLSIELITVCQQEPWAHLVVDGRYLPIPLPELDWKWIEQKPGVRQDRLTDAEMAAHLEWVAGFLLRHSSLLLTGRPGLWQTLTRSEDPALEQRLRSLLANWWADPTANEAELVGLGIPGLEHLLDLHRLVIPPPRSRDLQEAIAAARAAFARHDLDAFLAQTRRRGWRAVSVLGSGAGTVRDERILSMLLRAGHGPDPDDRKLVMALLGSQNDSRATRALTEALSDRSWRVRKAAVEALGEAGDPDAREALLSVARRRGESARWSELARCARTAMARLAASRRRS